MVEEIPIPQVSRPLLGYRVRFIEGKLRIRFFHFTDEEAEVARLFIQHGPLDGEWFCDIRLPSRKARWVVEAEEPWRTMWYHLTSKRIDLLCVQKDNIHIIEVKRYMLPAGIGQLDLYYDMFTEFYKPLVPVTLWFVAYYPDPDVIAKCRRRGIRTWSFIKV